MGRAARRLCCCPLPTTCCKQGAMTPTSCAAGSTGRTRWRLRPPARCLATTLHLWRRCRSPRRTRTFAHFEQLLKALYRDFTFERAAADASLRRKHCTGCRMDCRLPGAAGGACIGAPRRIGNLGGWQLARCLFLLNVLTGSVGTRGGTWGNEWNKFVPKPFASPPAGTAWNELEFPDEWPLAHYEMSFLLPHLLEEQRDSSDISTASTTRCGRTPTALCGMKALRGMESKSSAMLHSRPHGTNRRGLPITCCLWATPANATTS